MNFKMIKNVLGNVIYYKSDLKTLIIEDPFNNTEFNRYLPNYIILKENDSYACMKLKSYITDYMKETGYITNIIDIYNEYTVIWDGLVKLKDAKEFIKEYDKINNN